MKLVLVIAVAIIVGSTIGGLSQYLEPRPFGSTAMLAGGIFALWAKWLVEK